MLPAGISPQDRDGFRVIYFQGDLSQLSRRSVAQGTSSAVCKLKFTSTWDLPHREHAGLRSQIGSASTFDETYDKLCATVSGASGPYHHLLGHAQPLTTPMEVTCQLVANGIDCSAEFPVSHREFDRVSSLERGAADWVLLLQIDADQGCPGWSFGNGGRLFFWIRRDDLAASRFENAWAILQTTD